MNSRPPLVETASSRRIGGQALIALGVVAVVLGSLWLYEGKPATPDDGVLARLLLTIFEPRMASSVADMFFVAFGVASVIYGFLRIKSKA